MSLLELLRRNEMKQKCLLLATYQQSFAFPFAHSSSGRTKDHPRCITKRLVSGGQMGRYSA